jgi:hypothetical protein
VGARQAQRLSQEVDQQLAGLDLADVLLAVYGHRDRYTACHVSLLPLNGNVSLSVRET